MSEKIEEYLRKTADGGFTAALVPSEARAILAELADLRRRLEAATREAAPPPPPAAGDARAMAERIVAAVCATWMNPYGESTLDTDEIHARYEELKGKNSFTDSAIRARVEFIERILRAATPEPLRPVAIAGDPKVNAIVKVGAGEMIHVHGFEDVGAAIEFARDRGGWIEYPETWTHHPAAPAAKEEPTS